METLKRLIGGAVLASMLTVGCATFNDSLDNWMGHSKQELYDKWGPPIGVRSDGQGGRISVYRVSGGPRGTTVVYMYSQADGTLYYWRWQE